MTNYTQWKSLVDLQEYSAIPDSENLQAVYDPSTFDLSDEDEIEENWIDDSNNGNDASPVGSPVYRESVANGKPAVEFDENSYFDTGYTIDTSEPRSVYAVVEVHSLIGGSDQGFWYGAIEDAEAFLGIDQGQLDAVWGDGRDERGPSATTGEWLMYSHVIENADVDTYENGDFQFDTSANPDGDTTATVTIGARNRPEDDTIALDGKIAYLLDYTTDHDDETRQEVESFLDDKFDVTD